jgi:hypothetical protein
MAWTWEADGGERHGTGPVRDLAQFCIKYLRDPALWLSVLVTAGDRSRDGLRASGRTTPIEYAFAVSAAELLHVNEG